MAPVPVAKRRIGTRKQIIGALFRVLARQVEHMEMEMTSTGDKEVALLGNVAKTLEKLMEIERAQGGGKVSPQRRKDIATLRTKLAKRIDELRQV